MPTKGGRRSGREGLDFTTFVSIPSFALPIPVCACRCGSSSALSRLPTTATLWHDHPMVEYFIVFLGAGIGGVLRYGVNAIAARFAAELLPVATAFVNVSGSFVMGYLSAWFTLHVGSPSTRLFLTTGILGGFTTFSTFSIEVVTFHENSQGWLAALYALSSVLFSVSAAFLGLWVGRHFATP